MPDVPMANPETGNPGVGGTQFLLFALPHYLDKYYADEFEFLLLAECKDSLESKFKTLAVKDLAETARLAHSEACDIIIFRPSYDRETKLFLKEIQQSGVRAIAWFHNTPVLLLGLLTKHEYIKRCICVSREQFERLRDHAVISKLSMIYNALDSSNLPDLSSVRKTKSVVFLGSLVFAKGFHILARLWKKVLRYHPDAELYVIGTGKLYNRKQELGPMGLADRKYERMFCKHLLNEEGNIHESVRFLGIMGAEKFQVMSSAAAGISNHPRVTETFSLAAVEFQLCGTPVVSSARGGLLDTVAHGKGGFLVKKRREILKYLLYFLSDLRLAAEMGQKGNAIVKDKFNYQGISHDWYQLIMEVISNAELNVPDILFPESNQIRNLREKLRILKSKYSIFRFIPASIYLVQGTESLKLRWERLYLSFSGMFSIRKENIDEGKSNPA